MIGSPRECFPQRSWKIFYKRDTWKNILQINIYIYYITRGTHIPRVPPHLLHFSSPHIRTHIHTHTHINMCIRIYTPKWVAKRAFFAAIFKPLYCKSHRMLWLMYTHILTHTHRNSCIRTYTHVYTHLDRVAKGAFFTEVFQPLYCISHRILRLMYTHINTHTHTNTYMYMYIYTCIYTPW